MKTDAAMIMIDLCKSQFVVSWIALVKRMITFLGLYPGHPAPRIWIFHPLLRKLTN